MNIISINDALESDFFSSEDGENFQNYAPTSIDAMITQIITPILNQVAEIPTDRLPMKTKHMQSIRRYLKDLRKVTGIDHIEAANRSLDVRGIIGEDGDDAIELRGKKTEWNCCKNVSERLGARLAEIIKEDRELGNVFIVQIETENSSYPLVVHLLKSIKNKLK